MLKLGGRKLPWSNMPEGVLGLFFIQIVSTLSYSVLYSTLILYMKDKLGLQTTSANSIMGIFIALNYGLHLLGGFMGGRLFSNRALFCIGMLAEVIGCMFLSISSIDCLYYGLAAFLTGASLNVTCVNCILTQRFAPDDTRRETAFIWNYAGMNIGFFIGFSLSGFFQLTQSYSSLFLLSSAGNVIALLICLYFWKQFADINTAYSQKDNQAKRKGNRLGLLAIGLLAFTLIPMLHYADWANKFVIASGIAIMILIVVLAYRQETIDARNKLFAFAILMIVSTVFYMLYQTAPMGLTLFIENNVQRTYGSFTIPPQWFQNMNTITIVIAGPLLSMLFSRMRSKGMQINIPSQFAWSLIFIGIAFAILPFCIHYANPEGFVNPLWIVASFILQSIGELLISPIGYAMIGFLAPPSLLGVMMGMWMLNTGVGATLSSYSSNLMTTDQNSVSPLLTNSAYSQVFFMLGLLALVAAFVLFVFTPKLKQLMNEQKLVPDNKDSNLIAAERVSM